MQFPESWLRHFVDPDLSSEALAQCLTMAGLEVEALHPVAPPTHKIVVGQVIETVKHPNADRLKVCQVDVGAGENLSIVCGAPNVTPGIKVPCALVGAQLPPPRAGDAPFSIKLGKLRGVESQGMLCSGRELKVSEDQDGLLILPADARVGEDIRAALQLDDTIFEIKLTPNKADCLSVFGVAREVAAATGAPLRMPVFSAAPVSIADTVPVTITAPDLCGRFSGRVIRDVNAQAQTPAWMVRRLERAGQRSISALVDISNYVMLELGRPSHVFDLEKLDSGLDVRWGQTGESLKLLNGTTIALDGTAGVIADARQAQSLAGIMGGDSTAVTLQTRHIYLEAAFWWPDSIRGRARRYRLSSDAAYRFERGVDYATTALHLEYITALILDICGGNAGPVSDECVNLPKRAPVTMRIERAARVLGVPLEVDEVARIFTRLGFSFEQRDGVFVVMPPTYRFDLEIEEDLIEEVARLYGFDNIPARAPVAPNKMGAVSETQRTLHVMRHQLAARDYQETIGFSFVEEAWEHDFTDNAAPIRILNPISSQKPVMRSTLAGSLIDTLRYNLNRKAERVRLFETGRVFRRQAEVRDGDLTVAGLAQPMMIGALAYGQQWEEQWGAPHRLVDFFDVKADLEVLLASTSAITRFIPMTLSDGHPALHPGRSAWVELSNVRIGWIGELHPRWQQKYDLPHAPILFEVEAQALMAQRLPQLVDVPKFPPVHRDIAVIVPQTVNAQALLDALQQARSEEDCKAVTRIALFDEYKPKDASLGSFSPGEKSLAFRITLQDTEGTLQDETVDHAVQIMAQRLARQFGARLRS